MYADDLEEARQAVSDRLLDIERLLASATQRDLWQEIHSLKGLGAAYGMTVIEGLSHALEQYLETAGASREGILAFLDRMNEASESDRLDDASYLASLLHTVSERLLGLRTAA